MFRQPIMLFFFTILVLSAGMDTLAGENKVYLQNGQIIVKTDQGERGLNYNDGFQYTPAAGGRWMTRQESNPVDQALAVYKNKSRPLYLNRYWIYDPGNSSLQYLLEFTGRGGEQLIFSPDGNFAYYAGLSPQGLGTIYGLNILHKQTFEIGTGEDYQLSVCPDAASFVAVKNSAREGSYIIYGLDGKKLGTLENQKSFEEVKDAYCQTK